MSKNVETVQAIYAAFGRGDVPAILEHVAEDVDWEYGGIEEVPYLRHRRGRAAVAEFFQAVADELQIDQFAVKAVLDGPSVVVALVDLKGSAKRTGRAIAEEDEAHLWHFDAQGRIVRFRHRADTLMHARAFARA